MLTRATKTIPAGVATAALLSTAASAQTTLRIQTHQGQSSSYGAAIQEFVDVVNVMSGGDLQIEMFYSSSVVPSSETFDAAINGLTDDADASTRGNSQRIGTYDISKHSNFPGFQLMVADHLACRADVWEGLTKQQRTIIEVAYQNVAMDLILQTLVDKGETLAKLPSMDVTTYNWSAEDRATCRAAAQEQWNIYGGETEEGTAMAGSHVAVLQRIGLISGPSTQTS